MNGVKEMISDISNFIIPQIKRFDEKIKHLMYNAVLMKYSPSKLSYLILLIIIFSGCSSFKPKEVGLKDGKLRPCPPAPKCVSSYYEKGIHHIPPLKYARSKQEAYEKIIKVIKVIEKSTIVETKPNYIHAQFEVTRIKWIDNTEFLFDEEKKVIHYSSTPSAKIGFWDWGENKRRAKLIKKLFEQENDPYE